MQRNNMRQVFFDCFHKYQHQLPLEPLEQQLTDIILAHPEYHAILADPNTYLEKGFTDHNPFLHLSLHLAVREQIQTNRPAGILTVYQQLIKKYQDPLQVEHRMMEQLESILWQAEKASTIPDEQIYLEYLKKII